MRRIFLPCALGKARKRIFLIGIYDQAGSNRGPYHRQWIGSFPLLEYNMVWTRCRFDTPGNLISPDCPQRTDPLHCHLVAVIDYSYSLQNTLLAAAA